MPCPERENPISEREIDIGFGPPPQDIPEWSGFTIFSDVHSSTPPDDLQQSAPLQLACFIWCNEPECGGEGGWVVWWTNNPGDLELGCASPNNPWGYLL